MAVQPRKHRSESSALHIDMRAELSVGRLCCCTAGRCLLVGSCPVSQHRSLVRGVSVGYRHSVSSQSKFECHFQLNNIRSMTTCCSIPEATKPSKRHKIKVCIYIRNTVKACILGRYVAGAVRILERLPISAVRALLLRHNGAFTTAAGLHGHACSVPVARVESYTLRVISHV